MDVLLDYVRKEKAGLLLVTHDEEMSALCDKKYRLEDKRLDLIPNPI